MENEPHATGKRPDTPPKQNR